jgi:transposase, IS5 family
MRPEQGTAVPRDGLFRARLENLAEPPHPLVGGRPGMPTRLMVGLHLPKQVDGFSDGAASARYWDSPQAEFSAARPFSNTPCRWTAHR